MQQSPSRLPRPTHRRPTRRAGVLLVLGAAVFLGACGGQARQPTKYDDAYQENFMFGCTGRLEDGDVPEGGEALESEAYCKCVYAGLKDKVPFEEVRSFEEKQAEAESGSDIEVPANIQRIFDSCESGA